MEPGSKKPTAPFEACWTIICPVVYCGANAGNPCMNAQGRFALKTHVLRRKYYETRQAEDKAYDAGIYQRRPQGNYAGVSFFQRNQDLIERLDGLDGHVTNKYLDSLFVEDEDFDPFWDLEDDFFDECS